VEKYIIKTVKDGQEEIVYTKQYDELEREFFESKICDEFSQIVEKEVA